MDDPTVDPFEKAGLEKKERIVKNQLSHVRNLQRAERSAGGRGGVGGPIDKFNEGVGGGGGAGGGGGGAAPAGGAGVRKGKKGRKMERKQAEKQAKRAASAGGGAGAGGGVVDKEHARANAGKEPKHVKARRLAAAQVSTASLGKFDRRLRDEPAPPVPRAMKRRLPDMATDAERSRDRNVLRRVLMRED